MHTIVGIFLFQVMLVGFIKEHFTLKEFVQRCHKMKKDFCQITFIFNLHSQWQVKFNCWVKHVPSTPCTIWSNETMKSEMTLTSREKRRITRLNHDILCMSFSFYLHCFARRWMHFFIQRVKGFAFRHRIGNKNASNFWQWKFKTSVEKCWKQFFRW